jgi:hypothetical protein
LNPEILLAGSIGALLVFVLGTLGTVLRRDREQVGILRLLLAEIHHNIAVVQTLGHWRGAVLNIDARLLPRLKAEVWRAVRVRGAQLLPEELTTTLNDYYSPLDNVITLQNLKEAPGELDLSNDVMMQALGQLAQPQYAGPPFLYEDYALYALEAQNTARQQVEDHLASPLKRHPWLTGRVGGFAIKRRQAT